MANRDNVIYLASAQAACGCGRELAPHPAEARLRGLCAERECCNTCGRAVTPEPLEFLPIDHEHGPCVICSAPCGPGDAYAVDEQGFVCASCLDALHEGFPAQQDIQRGLTLVP